MKKSQTAFLKLCLADALVKLMQEQEFDRINVSAICALAGVGRTTFYRHFGTKGSKEDLLVFKIEDEWERYAEKHEEEVEADNGLALARFIYENKRLFALIDEQGLVVVLMRSIERLMTGGEPSEKSSSYLEAFFVYGYFGIIYRWIKQGFDETPDQVRNLIGSALEAGIPVDGRS